MPDRDEFTALHPLMRPAAAAISRSVRNGDLELEPVARSLEHLLSGGGWSPRPLLMCIASLGGDSRQGLFQDDSFARVSRAALERIHQKLREHRSDWRNDLLCQAAIPACESGTYDVQDILRSFLMRVLERAIIAPRGGVNVQLARRQSTLDPERLEKQLAPVLDAFVVFMLHNPDLRRPRLASRFRREIDLHGENLLEVHA